MNGTPEHRVRMHELATGLKQAGFPQWLLRIDLSDVWKNPAMSFGERRDVVTARLRESAWYAARVQDAGEGRPDVLAMIVEELGDALDADAFNCAWDEICNMADADRVWLNLHGVPEGSASPDRTPG